MILRWEQGRALIDGLIVDNRLQRVPANADLAHSYLDQSRAHLDVSEANVERDPIGSFQLAYDAARKALASLLLMQGLRPTSSGGHIAVYDAVLAQFGTGVMTETIRPFASMRRLRNTTEYPSLDQPVATDDDARRAQAQARAMLEMSERLIDQLPVY
jgi:hypothetical protein